MKIFRKSLLTICLFLISTVIFPQEGNIWFFGNGSGVDFNSNPPEILAGEISTIEACGSISDDLGNLLFYTDGVTVWDQNHQVMQNGDFLYGHLSTSQILILKKPNSDHLYYIFTTDAWQNNFSYGFRYSIVDMSLNNGLGAITDKNILINQDCVEKVCAIKKCDSNDYWILIHGFNNNTFYNYSFDESGINNDPILSTVGTIHGYEYLQGVGCMVASPDASMIGLAIKNKFLLEIFQFDNQTGILSNPIDIHVPVNRYPYGLQFSPNSNILYASIANPFSMRQYDLTEYSEFDIQNSELVIGDCPDCPMGESSHGVLQIGPEEKIYFCPRGIPYLGIIHNPNILGSGCGYDLNAVFLNGSLIEGGLPYFPADFFKQVSNVAINLENTSDCPDQAVLQITNFSDFDQIYYNINNGNTYYLTPTDQVIDYSFIQEGNYNFNITATKDCVIHNALVTINYTIPTPIDSTYYWCAGEPLLVDNVVYYNDTIINTSMFDNNGCSYPLNLTINFLPEPIINTELECVSPTLYNAFINIENGSNYYISSNYEGFPSGWIDNNFYLMDINTMDTIHYSITPIGDGACAYSYVINPLICTSALAISCYHLIGQPTKTGNLLAWQCDALNPSDSESINLMKSEDGKSFTLLKKYSFGTSFSDSHFEYLDANPAEHSYYQLWIESAELHKSNIIFIDKNDAQTEDSYISPMWINGHQLFSYVPEQFTSYSLFSIDGSLITNGIIDNNNHTLLLDFSGLPSGLYLVHLEDGLGGYTHKISYTRY
jgi:hypothetical protein